MPACVLLGLDELAIGVVLFFIWGYRKVFRRKNGSTQR